MDRLLLETDAPWCGIKASHASALHVRSTRPCVKKEKHSAGAMVKDRNEPACTAAVAEVLAALKGVSVQEVAGAATVNAVALFGPGLCGGA